MKFLLPAFLLIVVALHSFAQKVEIENQTERCKASEVFCKNLITADSMFDTYKLMCKATDQVYPIDYFVNGVKYPIWAHIFSDFSNGYYETHVLVENSATEAFVILIRFYPKGKAYVSILTRIQGVVKEVDYYETKPDDRILIKSNDNFYNEKITLPSGSYLTISGMQYIREVYIWNYEVKMTLPEYQLNFK